MGKAIYEIYKYMLKYEVVFYRVSDKIMYRNRYGMIREVDNVRWAGYDIIYKYTNYGTNK